MSLILLSMCIKRLVGFPQSLIYQVPVNLTSFKTKYVRVLTIV